MRTTYTEAAVKQAERENEAERLHTLLLNLVNALDEEQVCLIHHPDTAAALYAARRAVVN